MPDVSAVLLQERSEPLFILFLDDGVVVAWRAVKGDIHKDLIPFGCFVVDGVPEPRGEDLTPETTDQDTGFDI